MIAAALEGALAPRVPPDERPLNIFLGANMMQFREGIDEIREDDLADWTVDDNNALLARGVSPVLGT